MYSLRVEAQQRETSTVNLASLQEFPELGSVDTSKANQPSSPTHACSSEQQQAGDVQDEQLTISDSVEFTAGNPRVEHITGVVHLFREIPDRDAAHTSIPDPAAEATSSAWHINANLLRERQPTLCCLAIPADMSLADFCLWCGAYLSTIRTMRVLRREAKQRVVCMVLIQFVDQVHADLFYTDYNLKPFSSLEPEIMCRLVFVREVQIFSPSQQTSTPSTSATLSTSATQPIVDDTITSIKSPALSKTPSGAGQAEGSSQVASRPSLEQGLLVLGLWPTASGSGAAGSVEGGAAAANSAGQQVLGTELPTCPVCLERLDEHISGVVTTVCNHQFHSDCLLKWGDTSCPVCRYCTQAHANASRCVSCNASHDLWICLICGHVGCGRYKAGHANDHWKSHSHCYALELETQRVWDYAGDNYVHRLIQSKTDGKLVEVPTPAPPRQRRGRRHGRHSAASGRARGSAGFHRCTPAPAPSGDSDDPHDMMYDPDDMSDWSEGEEHDDLKDAMMASKLDHVADEYNHLLTSQLESQRSYYEGLLAQQAASFSHRIAVADASNAAHQASVTSASAAVKEAERKKQAVEKKLMDLTAAHTKLTEERDFLKSLSDNLLTNQKELRVQLDALKAQVADKDKQLVEMQEQVRDLMVFIEAGRMIGSSEDLKDATIIAAPAASTPGSSKGKGRSKAK